MILICELVFSSGLGIYKLSPFGVPPGIDRRFQGLVAMGILFLAEIGAGRVAYRVNLLIFRNQIRRRQSVPRPLGKELKIATPVRAWCEDCSERNIPCDPRLPPTAKNAKVPDADQEPSVDIHHTSIISSSQPQRMSDKPTIFSKHSVFRRSSYRTRTIVSNFSRPSLSVAEQMQLQEEEGKNIRWTLTLFFKFVFFVNPAECTEEARSFRRDFFSLLNDHAAKVVAFLVSNVALVIFDVCYRYNLLVNLQIS